MDIEKVIALSDSSALKFNAYLDGAFVYIPVSKGSKFYWKFKREHKSFNFLGIQKVES